MVPEALAGPGTRGARLGAHGKRAARRAKGLEAALVDRERRTVVALPPTDERSREIWIAGPAALVVAKLHKIGERVGAQDRARDNDALDLYRLLQVVPTSTASNLPNRVGTSVRPIRPAEMQRRSPLPRAATPPWKGRCARRREAEVRANQTDGGSVRPPNPDASPR